MLVAAIQFAVLSAPLLATISACMPAAPAVVSVRDLTHALASLRHVRAAQCTHSVGVLCHLHVRRRNQVSGAPWAWHWALDGHVMNVIGNVDEM